MLGASQTILTRMLVIDYLLILFVKLRAFYLRKVPFTLNFNVSVTLTDFIQMKSFGNFPIGGIYHKVRFDVQTTSYLVMDYISHVCAFRPLVVCCEVLVLMSVKISSFHKPRFKICDFYRFEHY